MLYQKKSLFFGINSYLLLTILFFFTLQKSKAQDSLVAINSFPQQVGFTNPELLKRVIDYRLPDWGYSYWSMSGFWNGFYKDQNVEVALTPAQNRNSLSTNLQLQPSYYKYNESEVRTSLFSVNQFIRFNGSDKDADMDDNVSNSKTIDFLHQIEIVFDDYNYVSAESKYFHGSAIQLSNNLSMNRFEAFSRPQNSNTTKIKNITYSNTFKADLGYRFGFGRLRDVTPVMYALRFSDRLRHIGKDYPSDEKTIQTMAEVFAKNAAYSPLVAFRPEKYFWNSIFSTLPNQPTLSPFEVNYLQETLIEMGLNRMEGYRLEIRPTVHLEIVDRTKEGLYGETDMNSLDPGLILNYRYAHNKSLNSYFRFNSDFSYSYRNIFEWNENSIRPGHQIKLSNVGSWSTFIADRLVFGRYIGLNVQQTEQQNFISNWIAYSGINFTYFVEQNFTLTTTMNYQYDNTYVKNVTTNTKIQHNVNNQIIFLINLNYIFNSSIQ